MAPVLWIGHPRLSGGAGAQGPLPEPSHFAGAEQETGSSLPLMPACKTSLSATIGASRNWHHASQAYDHSATGTGTASAPNPKDESGTQARGNRPASAPSPSSAAPKTSLNGSQRWQTSRLWSSRRSTASCRRRSSGRSGDRGWRPWPRPRRSCVTCPKSLCEDKKSLVGDSPHGQSGHFRRGTPHDSHHHQDSKSGWPGPPEPPCGWEASTLSFSMPSTSGRSQRPTSSSSALAFQTIYDAAAKRAHNSIPRCVIHYATGDSEEEGATLKLTHGETAFQKFRAVTGLEPSRVLAPAGRWTCRSGPPAPAPARGGGRQPLVLA